MRNTEIIAEEKLLLCLCGLKSRIDLQLVKSLVAEIKDWKYFSDLANQHGLAALVFHNLGHQGLLNLIPGEIAGFLRNASLKSLAFNSGIFHMIGEVLDILGTQNIKTVLLKGMALEIMVYGNKGLRQMNDADVLIGKKDCMRAHCVLKNNGYEALPLKSMLHNLIIRHTGKHLPTLIMNGFSLEIHHDLFNREGSILTDNFMDNSIETELAGRKVYLPEPMMFFLYLVKHLHSHELNNESQLRLYTDLVALIEKYKEEILNQDLVLLAEKAELSEILAFKLGLLRDFLYISFPDWLNRFIDGRNRAESVNSFIFFLKSPKNNPAVARSDSYRSKLKEIPGFHRRVIYVIGDLFPTISFMKKRYNCTTLAGAMIYYPHRFGKLVWLFRKQKEA